MPKYVYFCNECDGIFEVKHSLQKIWQICNICNVSGSIERRPVGFFLSKKQDKLEGKSKTGAVVKDTIEDIRQDLKAEKDNLSSRSFKDVK